jgi:hypothetical protein
MTVTIHIQNHEGRGNVYYPGDRITGTLCLNGPIRDTALEIYVTLNGNTQVEIEEYRNGHNGSGGTILTYRNNTRLFSIKQVLFKGQCYLSKNQTRTWDFCLWLPQQGLPPSFHFDSTSPRADGVKAEIQYYLKASAHESSFFKSDPRTISPFYVQPRRHPTAESRYQSVAQLVNSKGSLWNKTKIFFRRIRRKLPGCQNPGADELESIINLNAILPSTIGLGEAHTASFEFTNDISTKAPVAAIKILELKHKVIAETSFLAAGISEKRHRDVWRFKSKDGLPFIEDGKRINIDLTGIGSFETVSFDSASISRVYWSRTTMKVDFGGERRTVRFDIPVLTVLPPVDPSPITEVEK